MEKVCIKCLESIDSVLVFFEKKFNQVRKYIDRTHKFNSTLLTLLDKFCFDGCTLVSGHCISGPDSLLLTPLSRKYLFNSF